MYRGIFRGKIPRYIMDNVNKGLACDLTKLKNLNEFLQNPDFQSKLPPPYSFFLTCH